MKMVRRALTIVVLTVAASSSGSASVGTRWGPNGNGTLAHVDDVRWLDLHDAKVTADAAAGIYTARFGPLLQQMDKQDFVITGFMMPVVANIASNHFVITRRSAGCPFCPPNEPTEAIEVFSQKLVQYTDRPVTVEGKLHLVGNSEKGLFYRLDAATVH